MWWTIHFKALKILTFEHVCKATAGNRKGQTADAPDGENNKLSKNFTQKLQKWLDYLFDIKSIRWRWLANFLNLFNAVNRDVLIKVYFPCFHSVMSYGILVWGNNTEPAKIFLRQKESSGAVVSWASYIL